MVNHSHQNWRMVHAAEEALGTQPHAHCLGFKKPLAREGERALSPVVLGGLVRPFRSKIFLKASLCYNVTQFTTGGTIY